MTFELFQKLMFFDTQGRFCIEIFFTVKGNAKFDCCWMGKMPDRETKQDVFGMASRLMVKMHMTIRLLKNFHLSIFLMANPFWRFGITL